MANSVFATFNKVVTAQQVNFVIEKINKERFNSYFQIRFSEGKIASVWDFIEPDKWCFISIGMDHRVNRLGWKHVRGTFRQWIQEYFGQSIAEYFGAIMSDEGVPEKWTPSFHKEYKTPKDYCYAIRNHGVNSRREKMFGYLDFRKQRKLVPKELFKFSMENNLDFALEKE